MANVLLVSPTLSLQSAVVVVSAAFGTFFFTIVILTVVHSDEIKGLENLECITF